MKRTILALSWLLLATSSKAAIITVDDDGPADFRNIQAAINYSHDGYIIEVKPGTYTGPGNRDIDFLGKAITVRSTDPNDPNIVSTTIIDCNGTETKPHRGFYFDSGETPDSQVEGLTITNGWASEVRESWGVTGGAIFCFISSPTIRNCIIRNNYSSGTGGGIWCYYSNSNPQIENCSIYENTGGGAGIYCGYLSGPTISNCIISDNIGDAIVCNGSSGVTISNCIINNNEGDGICCDDDRGMIIGCTINNNATGIELHQSGALVDNCVISGNINSGIKCIVHVSTTISNCRITGNFASDGAGIHCRYAEPQIRNCIISNNLALREGGGMYFLGHLDRPSVINCVITNNEALRYGGGIYGICSRRALKIANSILWGNAAEYGSEVALGWDHHQSNILTISHSVVKGGQQRFYMESGCTLNWGEGMIDTEPGFAFEGDYHLASDSLCIDSGTNNPPGWLPSLDIDGNLRPLDGDGDSNAIADIGIYEFNPQLPSIALSAQSAEFFTQEGTNPTNQIISVRNCGGGTLSWEIIEDCNWLKATPASGTSNGEVNDIVLDVNAMGLTHGDYIGELQVVDEQAVNNPRTVLVTLHVNATLQVPLEYDTIQAAIDDAVDLDVVLVSDSTYRGEGNRNLDFEGKNIIVRSENGPDTCIIDCQSQGRGFYLHSRESSSAVIEGFTIINGCTDQMGGGICCIGYSSPSIKNCVIKNCTSTAQGSYGNGIFCSYSYGTNIENCTLQGNRGGIAAIYGVAIRNCVITDNYDAPGILCAGGRPTIKDCIINDNQGGGITLTRNDAIVENCVIMGNAVREEHLYFAIGGGISCSMRSSPTIKNTVILGNFTEFGGGGICCNMDSNAKIINCTIAGNRASLCGGGLWSLSFCSPVVSNSILWGNTAEVGSQIAQEHPDYPGSGDTTLSVTHSDVEGGQGDVYVDPSCTLVWHPGNIDADPCLTEPGYWDANGLWVEGDYHLLTSSPCIDAGDPNYIAEPNETDLDGKPRVIGGRIDMGAYEYRPTIPTEVRIVPRTINLASKGKWITCYIWLGEDYDVADIDPNSTLLEDEIEPERFSVDEKQQIAVVRFNRSEVQGILSIGDVELTISGQLMDGTVFESTDVIRVIDKGGGKSA